MVEMVLWRVRAASSGAIRASGADMRAMLSGHPSHSVATGSVPAVIEGRASSCAWRSDLKRNKGIWWMPWRQEAMKDVARCEKPRGDASNR
jgi:hypothetical protein